jgi:hypothetical protein
LPIGDILTRGVKRRPARRPDARAAGRCYHRFGAECEERIVNAKPYWQLLAAGSASATLYVLVYLYEREIMALFTRTDGLYPALPVLTAFVFSLVHGAFANYLWDVIGIRGRHT